jgi:beta-glucanase (GH16 family)
MMRSARLLVVAVLCALAFTPSPAVRAHESQIEPLETAPPVIARTTVYTFRGDYLDARHWRIVQHGGAGKGTAHPELQYYDDEAVTVSRGVLHLSALQLKQLDPADGMDYPYVSGRIESADAYLYGRFEVRLKVPNGDGLWPAVWLRSPENTGRVAGQIDIYDGFGSHADGFTAASAKWIDGRQVAATCIIVENFTSDSRCRRVGNPQRRRINYSRDYHTFGIDWQPDHLTWYVDRQPYWTITKDVPNVPMVLIMDLAVGGAQDSNPPIYHFFRTRFPADFEIASVTITK